MEQQKGARLNGWQRLWIAIAVISIVPMVAMVLGDWESGDAWMRDLQQMPPTTVTVEGVGPMEFPATMSAEAIALVTRGSGGNPDAIRAGIRTWGSEFNKLIRGYIGMLNRDLVIRAIAVWAIGLALLYGFGWLVAWVRRGFRT
jgi:hypothetical protein